MKKIFFFALASLALASCSQDEEFAPEKSANGSGRADNGVLTFSTYTAGGTRASVVTSKEVELNGFQVAAWYDSKLYFSDEAKNNTGTFVDGTDNVDGIFDTQSDTYYWPSFSAGNIEFRAFNNLTSATNKAEWADKDCKTVKYQPAATASAQEDLVIAYADVAEKPTTPILGVSKGVQPLNFTHALSKVNFSFVGANASNKYTINKIEVIAAGDSVDATKTGVPTLTFAETTELGTTGVDTDQPNLNTQAEKVTWAFTAIDADKALVKGLPDKSGSEQNQGVLYTYYNSADSATTTGVEVAGTTAANMNANLMLLPQSGKIAIRVYYKVEAANGKLIGNCGYYETDVMGHHNVSLKDNVVVEDGTVGAANDYTTGGILGCKTVVINLGNQNDDTDPTAVAIPAWVAGKSYRFNMTLPDDNFIGDGAASTGNTADGVADGSDDANTEDYDGDDDKDKSEFDQLTPIRFSVTVSDWVDVAANNITIK